MWCEIFNQSSKEQKNQFLRKEDIKFMEDMDFIGKPCSFFMKNGTVEQGVVIVSTPHTFQIQITPLMGCSLLKKDIMAVSQLG